MRVPITLVSGFLGAGKTTFLNSVLQEENSLRLAIVVNDMAEVSVDDQLVRRRSGDSFLELHGGCICCSLRGDLIRELTALVKNWPVDRVLIESTGIGEPRNVAAGFYADDSDAAALREICEIDSFVTFVDSRNFCGLFERAEDIDFDSFGVPRTVAEVLAEQIEFSNLVVLNKIDSADEGAVERVERIVRALNGGAKIVKANYSRLGLSDVLSSRSTLDQIQSGSRSISSMARAGESHVKDMGHGFSSIVWQARRPAHPERLWDVLSFSPNFKGVYRGKGFFWLASRRDEIGVFQLAGGSMQHYHGGKWWAATDQRFWPSSPSARGLMLEKFLGPEGDRRQEIVLIGSHVSSALLEELDGALLTDEELAQMKRGRRFSDPFPTWEI